MAAFNLLTADNDDLLQKISETVMNAYFAMRIINMPVISQDSTYEYAEAKFAHALFDGEIPSTEDFAGFAKTDPAQWPKYYTDISNIAKRVISVFNEMTGVNLMKDSVSIQDRAILWSILMDGTRLVDAVEPPKSQLHRPPEEEYESYNLDDDVDEDYV